MASVVHDAQLHSELDELQRQLNARHGNYGTSLASVKMTAQAFKQFSNAAKLIGAKVSLWAGDTMLVQLRARRTLQAARCVGDGNGWNNKA